MYFVRVSVGWGEGGYMRNLMCAREAGQVTTNAVCSRAYECPPWTHPAPEPFFTPDACGPCI